MFIESLTMVTEVINLFPVKQSISHLVVFTHMNTHTGTHTPHTHTYTVDSRYLELARDRETFSRYRGVRDTE